MTNPILKSSIRAYNLDMALNTEEGLISRCSEVKKPIIETRVLKDTSSWFANLQQSIMETAAKILKKSTLAALQILKTLLFSTLTDFSISASLRAASSTRSGKFSEDLLRQYIFVTCISTCNIVIDELIMSH